jgi:hypothetical protein
VTHLGDTSRLIYIFLQKRSPFWEREGATYPFIVNAAHDKAMATINVFSPE